MCSRFALLKRDADRLAAQLLARLPLPPALSTTPFTPNSDPSLPRFGQPTRSAHSSVCTPGATQPSPHPPSPAEDLLSNSTRHDEDLYNIPPGTPIPVFRNRFNLPLVSDYPSTDSPYTLHMWGLIPSWSPTPLPSRPHHNARIETLAEKPTFRPAFLQRRCLVPASGFYEWQTVGRAKFPWLFRPPDASPFWLAALWEPAPPSAKSTLPTCTLVTTPADECMTPFHHRMPLLLSLETALLWLTSGPLSPQTRLSLLPSFSPSRLTATPVTPALNHPTFNSPASLTPVPPPPRQLPLL